MPNGSVNTLTVDLGAIHHNLKNLTANFGQVMVMVKANAYGTDPLFLARFLQKFHSLPFLGVSHVCEGVFLRESGITAPIFVISAPPYESERTVFYDLIPAVSSFDEVVALDLAAKKGGKILPVHLHLNTGMNRFGISSKEGLDLYHKIRKCKNLHLEGVMTHFAAAESSDFDPFTYHQIDQFKAFLDSLPSRPRWIHAANSGGAIRFKLPFCNLIRIGLGIMGCGTCLTSSQPALSLTTKLASVSSCNQGESVGYNRTYKVTKENERIGVIPFGYHDGFHRSLSGKGYVLIRGKKAPMIGTICMDFMMIDLNAIPEASVGDEVVLFGKDLSAETVASWAETDVREILVSLPPRVKRMWLNPPLPTYSARIEKNDTDFGTERLPSSLYPFEKD